MMFFSFCIPILVRAPFLPPAPPILPHPTSLSTPQKRYPAFKTQNRTFLDFFLNIKVRADIKNFLDSLI